MKTGILEGDRRHAHTFVMTTHHNITFELYLNVETVISSQCWSASDGLLITVGGDFKLYAYSLCKAHSNRKVVTIQCGRRV